MRELMNLLESHMDYQPSPKLAALQQKLDAIREDAREQAQVEIVALLKQMKKLFPQTAMHWRSGMGVSSVTFDPPLEIEGGEYEIDALRDGVTNNDWRAARGDDRVGNLLGWAEQIFAINGFLSDHFRSEVDQAKA